MEVQIYQIFYNAKTRRSLDPGFIPLDNSRNLRPDWFEFWPIRNFLKGHAIQDSEWYGFLSPKFGSRIGVKSNFVRKIVEKAMTDHDVVLFSPFFASTAYFKNVFEQGERWHPGITQAANDFFARVGFDIDTDALVTHRRNTVFSNYLVAKGAFWKEWLALADPYFDFVESESCGSASSHASKTYYGGGGAPMKTFVQERFASAILAQGRFKAFVPDWIGYAESFSPELRRGLLCCDYLKELYCDTKDPSYLDRFFAVRAELHARCGADFLGWFRGSLRSDFLAMQREALRPVAGPTGVRRKLRGFLRQLIRGV